MKIRNVVLFLADQWRGDTLAAAGHPGIETPHLDGLIAEGVTFRQHYTTASPCGPARASLLTGLYMASHRMVQNGTPLDDRHDNLARAMRRSGREAAMFGYTSSVPDPRGLGPNDPALRNQHGTMVGFTDFAPGLPTHNAYMAHAKARGYEIPADREDFWLPDPAKAACAPDKGPTWAPAKFTSEHSDNAYLLDTALQYLSVREAEPWFIHLATMRPHPPFVATDPWHDKYDPADAPPARRRATWQEEAAQHPLLAELLAITRQRDYFRTGDGLAADIGERDIRQLRATYYGMIGEVDAQLGRLIAYLKDSGQYDETLFVFSSDHGEMLGDHYMLGKSGYFAEAYHIPLVIRMPGGAGGGRVVDRFTESIDVMPTILEAMGEPVPVQCDGSSLMPLLRGEAVTRWRDGVVFEFDFRGVGDANGFRQRHGLRLDQCCLASFRDARFQYVHFPALPPLLFDLATDPWCFENVAGQTRYAGVERDYAQRLLSWRMEAGERVLTGLRATKAGIVEERDPARWR
jgi:arylsulfatase A-like enzyme